jgi:hypothetical protein
MAYERIQESGLDTRKSAVDLTGKEYLACSVNAQNTLVVATAATPVIGVIQEGKPVGYSTTYAFEGQVKLQIAGAVAAGASIKSDANGKGVTAAAGEKAFARADLPGVNGDTITVTLDSHTA